MWFLPAAGVIVLIALVSLLLARRREKAVAQELAQTLLSNTSAPATGKVDFVSLSELPAPVAGYLKHVLGDEQPLLRTARLQQTGRLRTGTSGNRWLPFTADELVVPAAPGFLWNARIELPLKTHVRVLDGYLGGQGSGRASLLSACVVASERGAPELNSGALHRLLAEAVWFPTFLLPGLGVTWRPIDERRAEATLTHRDTTVSLEFRFNEQHEVAGIYTPARWGEIRQRVPTSALGRVFPRLSAAGRDARSRLWRGGMAPRWKPATGLERNSRPCRV